MNKFLKAIKERYNDFNDWLGSRLAIFLSSMACFYIVTFLVIAPLYWQRPVGVVAWMQYVISVFFQGVSLPLLGYVSQKSGDKVEKFILEIYKAIIDRMESKLDETHDAVMGEVKKINETSETVRQEMKELKELHAESREEIAELRKMEEGIERINETLSQILELLKQPKEAKKSGSNRRKSPGSGN